MFGFALSPIVRIAIIALFVASVIAGIYYKGRLDEHKLFDAYKAEVNAIAKALNITPRRVQQLKLEGLPSQGRGKYELGPCMFWYILV